MPGKGGRKLSVVEVLIIICIIGILLSIMGGGRSRTRHKAAAPPAATQAGKPGPSNPYFWRP